MCADRRASCGAAALVTPVVLSATRKANLREVAARSGVQLLHSRRGERWPTAPGSIAVAKSVR